MEGEEGGGLKIEDVEGRGISGLGKSMRSCRSVLPTNLAEGGGWRVEVGGLRVEGVEG